MRPYDRMNPTWAQIRVAANFFYRLPAELIIYAAVAGALQAIEYYTRSSQLQASLTDARLHALELQLQPHFLFNTLNAVASLVRTRKNDEAETEMLRRYLDIQRVRFADRMTYTIDVDANARVAAVPTLILQPLAENAIRHGIARSAAGGSVSVKAFRENVCLRVDIGNTGSLAGGDARGIGLRNTRERLRQLYGDDQAFSLRPADDG